MPLNVASIKQRSKDIEANILLKRENPTNYESSIIALLDDLTEYQAIQEKSSADLLKIIRKWKIFLLQTFGYVYNEKHSNEA